MILELGLPGQLTSHNYELLEKCVTNCWLKSVWRYCRDYEIELETDLELLEPARPNDRNLMETFVDARYDAEDLRKLCCCKNWLGVNYLSEITTADGLAVLREAYEGERLPQKIFNYNRA